MDRNTHEVPLGLQTRPTVAIRQLPGKVFRVPARGATIFGLGVLIWGIVFATTDVAWFTLLVVILVPVLVVCALVEMKPRGKQPLAWLYIMARHRARPRILYSQRLHGPALGPNPAPQAPTQRGRRTRR